MDDSKFDGDDVKDVLEDRSLVDVAEDDLVKEVRVVDENGDGILDDSLGESVDGANLKEKMLKFFEMYGAKASDVFADFGANSLFFIDGEALLAFCFADRTLDVAYGGEPLHVAYLFLSHLRQLQDRDARFRVVFFDNAEPLWIPSKRLVRSLLIRHLRKFSHTIDVDCFPSLNDKSFMDFMKWHSPTNIMTQIIWSAANSAEVSFYFIFYLMLTNFPCS
jgi:hypothetical protein